MSDYTREQIVEMIRKGKKIENADLSEIDLSGEDFRSKEDGGPCVKPAFFNKVKFYDSNLTKIKLNNAEFHDTLIYRSDLSFANLSGAYFWNTEIKGSGLRETDFNRARLRNQKILSSSFRGANLSYSDLCGASMHRTILSKANLKHANLCGANLDYTVLEEADISGANIYRVSCYDWKIDGIKCDHVYLVPFPFVSWKKLDEREKYRVDYKPGVFEALYNKFNSPFIDVGSIISRIRAYNAWEPTEESKKITEKCVSDWLNNGCICKHSQAAKYLWDKFNYGTFTQDLLPKELFKSLFGKKIIIELKIGHVDRKKPEEKKTFCFNGSIKKIEDLSNRLHIKHIDNKWYLSESSFLDEEDLDFLLGEGIIIRVDKDSDCVHFNSEITSKTILHERLAEIEDKCEVFYDKEQIMLLWLLSSHIEEIISFWQRYNKRKPPFEDVERPKETRRDYISRNNLIKILKGFYRDKGWGHLVYDPGNKQTKSQETNCPLPEHNHTTSA